MTSEGFDNIQITGARLDMDNDFKTWVGIIHAFAKHRVIGDKVTLPFVEFVALWYSTAALPHYVNGSMYHCSGSQLTLYRLQQKIRHTILT